MRGSGFAREARRRPELDLLVGPLEAATLEAATLEAATMDGDGSRADGSTPEDVELSDPAELPTWREDG
jgi:hypothetical protein